MADPPGFVHDPRHFVDRYAEDPDPWGFEDRWYERRKQALTLALLPEPRALSCGLPSPVVCGDRGRDRVGDPERRDPPGPT